MAAEKKRAEKTSFVIGYIGEDGEPIRDRTEMVDRRYAVTSFSHDEDSEKQQSESMRGGEADVFGEDGFLWGSGGLEMEVPLHGSLDILRTLLRDANPVSTAIPDKTLVAAGTDLSDIVAANYFSDTADATVKVVDAQMLDPSAEKTIADNLSAYREALMLTVTPDSDAASTNVATIVITYVDAEGETQTTLVTFATGALQTAQMAALPAGATITGISTTEWSAGKFDITTAIAGNIVRNPEPNRPGQLRFKFSEANAGGQIIVRGVRRVGLKSNDTLPMREVLKLSETADETTDVTLGKYFHRINKVEVKATDGSDFATGTVEVISSPGGYETVIKMSNEEVRLMMEAEVGGIPRRITGMEFISGQLNISNNVRLQIDALSKRVDQRSTIEGGDDEQFVATAAQHPTEFPFVTEKFFPDWGGYMELDGEAFVFDSATADINRNEDFDAGKRGSRFRADLDSSSRRNVTAQIQGSYISGTAEEDVFVRWDEKFRNNEAVNAKIANFHWPTNGRQHSMEWIMPYCEVTSPVRVEASGPGNIPITVDLKAVPDPTVAGASELEVRIVSDDQWT